MIAWMAYVQVSACFLGYELGLIYAARHQRHNASRWCLAGVFTCILAVAIVGLMRTL